MSQYSIVYSFVIRLELTQMMTNDLESNCGYICKFYENLQIYSWVSSTQLVKLGFHLLPLLPLWLSQTIFLFILQVYWGFYQVKAPPLPI